MILRPLIVASLLALAAAAPAALADGPAPATSDAFDFGDDTGDHALNGTCEDPRFEGDGVAAAEAALLHDATDCLTLFAEGRIDVTEDARSLHPEGPLDILDILTKIGKGGGKATDLQ